MAFEGYKITTTETALGTEHKFHGPGLSQYANGVHLMQPMNEWATKSVTSEDAEHAAETIRRLLVAAYQAGHEAARRELIDFMHSGKIH
jgi:hypothetical protein